MKVVKKHNVPKHGDFLQKRLALAVRSCRKQLGITQEELSWRADMHRTYLADIERGVRNITLRSLGNLAQALQLTVEDLLFHANGSSGLTEPGAGPKAGWIGEIVIVESNAKVAGISHRTFKQAKFANPVKVLRDGRQAMNYLFCKGRYAGRNSGPPQAVLIEVNLPKVSGVEILRSLKADHSTRNVPVVMLSASHRDPAIKECVRLGAACCIVKPVTFSNLATFTPKLNFHWALLQPASAWPGSAAAVRRH